MLKIAELCVNLHPKLNKSMSMKQTRTICALFATILIMTSCAGSSNEVTLYSDASITAFTLGKLNRYTETLDSDGVPQTKKTTFSAGNYKFVIDQVNRKIYNNDSLPVGTDVAHVLCNISTANNGVALFEDLKEEDTYYYYSSADSIDFTSPRTVRVMSSDGKGYTEYTIQINVHEEDGDKFEWNALDGSIQVQAMRGLKTLYQKKNIFLFCDLDGKTQVYRVDDNRNWDKIAQSMNFTSDAWKNVAVMDNVFYLFDGGILYKSDDGNEWTLVNFSAEQPVKQLIGASTYELYALSESNQIMASRDGGESWKVEKNDMPEKLPTEDITMVSYPVYMADNCEQVIMVGNLESEANEEYAVVWRKIVDFDNFDLGGTWTYMDRGSMTEFLLPRFDHYNLLAYEDYLLAFGKLPESKSKGKPYTTILQSRDNGITWKEKKGVFVFPENMANTNAATISSVVDKNKNIWLFCIGTGEIWKGRLNRAAWTYK